MYLPTDDLYDSDKSLTLISGAANLARLTNSN